MNGGENTVIKSNEEKTKEKEERKGVEKCACKKRLKRMLSDVSHRHIY